VPEQDLDHPEVLWHIADRKLRSVSVCFSLESRTRIESHRPRCRIIRDSVKCAGACDDGLTT
jgi:hypothetical protein